MSKFILSFLLFVKLFCLQAQTDSNNGRILFVTSNAHYYGDSDIPSSNHFSELVFPYDVFKKAGYKIDFLSPKGGAIPIGYINTSDPLIKEYIYDCSFMTKLKTTLSPSEVDADQYKAIYFGGGGASMFGIHDNTFIMDIASTIYEDQKGVLSSVCHGSISLSNIKSQDGSFLIEGKQVNGFPDIFENKEAGYFKQFEYSVEELLRLRGAHFKYSQDGWDGYYVKDGRIITGQDPTSAKKVAELVIQELNNKN